MKLTARQQLILKKAIPLFMKKGYNETSMHDISDLMDIKAASLYSHIKSKNDILVWICDDVQYRMSQIITDVENSEKNNVEKFQYFVYRHVEEILKHRFEYDIFLRYWKLVDQKNKNKYKKQYEFYQEFVENTIRNTVQHNIDLPCFQNDTVVHILLLILNHIPRWVRKGEEDPEKIAQAVLKKFLYGFEKI